MQERKMKVLFLGDGNSCRTQIAEGWVRHLKPDYIETYSAGIEPLHKLDPFAVKVMAEVGVDISRQRPKYFYDVKVLFVYYVLVCSQAISSLPLFPGSASVTSVCFDDPAGMADAFDTVEEKLNCYRTVRDQIKEFIKTFPEALKIH